MSYRHNFQFFCFQHLSPFYTLCRFCRDFQLGLIVPALLQKSISVISKLQNGNSSAAYADLTIMFFQSIRHNPFQKSLEEGE